MGSALDLFGGTRVHTRMRWAFNRSRQRHRIGRWERSCRGTGAGGPVTRSGFPFAGPGVLVELCDVLVGELLHLTLGRFHLVLGHATVGFTFFNPRLSSLICEEATRLSSDIFLQIFCELLAALGAEIRKDDG